MVIGLTLAKDITAKPPLPVYLGPSTDYRPIRPPSWQASQTSPAWVPRKDAARHRSWLAHATALLSPATDRAPRGSPPPAAGRPHTIQDATAPRAATSRQSMPARSASWPMPAMPRRPHPGNDPAAPGA